LKSHYHLTFIQFDINIRSEPHRYGQKKNNISIQFLMPHKNTRKYFMEILPLYRNHAMNEKKCQINQK